ncbi:zinc ribbon domain-containing protein [soil metagenome]
MPTYQYACTVDTCGHRFDAVQAFADDSLTDCPECAGRLRKIWGSIGVVFKGSGFYRNDSRQPEKTGKSDPSAAKSATLDSTAAKDSTGSKDAKPADKSGSASAATDKPGAPSKTKAGSATSSAAAS